MTSISNLYYKTKLPAALDRLRKETEGNLINLNSRILEVQQKCDHEIILVCGTEESILGEFYKCLICGKTYSQSTPRKAGSIYLDFSKNPISTLYVRGKHVISTKIIEELKAASDENLEMNLEQFVKTIPSEWYTSEEPFKDKLK